MDRAFLMQLEQGLTDMSYSEIAVLQKVCLSQVDQNRDRAGWAKIFTAIFFLLDSEKKRREAVLHETELAINS